MMRAAIGVDIGGTKIAAVLLRADGQHLTALEQPVPKISTDKQADPTQARQALLDDVVRLCQRIRAEAQHPELVGVGIGSAGQVDHSTGTIVAANDNLPGWAGTLLSQHVSERLKLPVVVDNDVRTMAIAESRRGAGQGYDHALYLTVGTGIGGAIMLNGALWRGAQHSAGEFGYLRATYESDIEQIAAGPAMQHAYQQRTGFALDLRQIVERAESGEEEAVRVLADGARALGDVLAPLLTFLGPQACIIGGGVPQIGDLWWRPLFGAIRYSGLRSAQAVAVLPARLGPSAGMIGAALMALETFTQDN
jgi:glucokinase